VAEAVALFRRRAPQVRLNLHVGTIAMIERGVMDNQFHLGVIPEHRRSDSLTYHELFDETMYLYAGAGHPWFEQADHAWGWDDLRQQDLAALGYHSPNMELSHQARLSRRATGFDQEAIATLILSGRFLGFLPDHYAEPFERQGLMQAVQPDALHYECQFVSLLRRSPQPGRAAQLFHDCLVRAHAKAAVPPT